MTEDRDITEPRAWVLKENITMQLIKEVNRIGSLVEIYRFYLEFLKLIKFE